NGLQITNVQGATGQYARYNGHNITLYNNPTRHLVDNGVYHPLVPPTDPNAAARLVGGLMEIAAHEAIQAGVERIGAVGTFVFGTALLQQGDVSHSRREDPYVVRLQAQGGGVEESVVLRGQDPITVDEGLTGLETLKARLSRKELQERADPFRRAERFIGNGPAGGGIGPPGKSFSVPESGGIRVDVEILRGINFRE